ncbi:uncharacterized protein SPSK_06644 [Sporothrix schenckii 1099-18]|uniref:Uncharacterized protein n=2 Tax=Sporothrix schenckii TaxID=29908 RepID=U7PU25_SPOS1|nr:uncharacterized protein SPSK_06644 [Sporothrix schenckii 1099-18]ERS98264.1 hypothetical protein HMPREF1624_05047 [Sporothrix schenckii ATCC 58251]KJR89626.1 hypothetical protein SPSK_06644 [Sporothrix schenckii 1099-18]
MEPPRLRTYTAEGTTPFPSLPTDANANANSNSTWNWNWNAQNRRASVKSLDENEKFTAHCNNALAKIRLGYIRLLARDKLETNTSRDVVRRRNSKVTPVHQFGKPAQFTKRTVTRTVSFSN